MPFIATDEGQRILYPFLGAGTLPEATNFGAAIRDPGHRRRSAHALDGAMSLDFGVMLLSAEGRLAQARSLADSCRDRGELHVFLMRSVFLMEDIVFMLHEMAALEHEARRDHGSLLADDRL